MRPFWWMHKECNKFWFGHGYVRMREDRKNAMMSGTCAECNFVSRGKRGGEDLSVILIDR